MAKKTLLPIFAWIINIAVQCASADISRADCDLGSIDAKNSIHSTVPLSGQPVNIVLHLRWTFTPQPDELIRITEIDDVEIPNLDQVLTSAALAGVDVQQDDCGLNESIDGSNISASRPTVTVHFDYSVAKWACAGANIPCPTTTEPLRMCYKSAKTIVGKGHGWYETYLTPMFADSGVTITTSQNSDFHVDQGSGVIGLVFGPIGPIGAFAGDLFSKAIKLDFPYPPIQIPEADIQEGESDTPIELKWTNSSVYFERKFTFIQNMFAALESSSIDLFRERYIIERPHTACYIHKALSSQ
jgi:hypothetical protein